LYDQFQNPPKDLIYLHIIEKYQNIFQKLPTMAMYTRRKNPPKKGVKKTPQKKSGEKNLSKVWKNFLTPFFFVVLFLSFYFCLFFVVLFVDFFCLFFNALLFYSL
jgi:uncharacterized membrane protein